MPHHSAVLRVDDIDDDFAARWDAMPAARGIQADIYDTHAWHAAWWHSHPEIRRRVHVVSVLDGDRPVALLPLVHAPGRIPRTAGAALRPRSRLILGAEEPDEAVLAALVDGAARAGVRSLSLHRLPTHDPGTPALLQALRTAGFRVAATERSSDNLARVEGGWADHAARFKGFAGYAKRFAGRMSSLWDLRIDTYGVPQGAPVARGFERYAELQGRSWKGPYEPRIRTLRAELLRRAAERDWARVYILSASGVPVAGHVWFRLGDVALWLSTAYDRSMAVLSPGTVAQWWAQEQIFHDPTRPPPRLIDFLPGASAQKARLAPERPPLMEVEARRGRVVSGVSLPVRRHLRRAVPAVRARARVIADYARPTLLSPPGGGGPVALFAPVGPQTSMTPLALDAAVRRYLATVTGAPSAEAVVATWDAGDTWWRVGPGPSALVRIGDEPDLTVREVVRLDPAYGLDALAADLDLGAGPETEAAVHDVRMPWPEAWREAVPATGSRVGER